MSLAAILEATRDHLRAELGLSDKFVSVQEDGQPPPFTGEVHYVVHPLAWQPETTEPDKDLLERFSVGVTVTQRTAFMPRDRRMEEAYLRSFAGLEDRLRAVMLAVHLNYQLFASANARMNGTSKLCEPLRWLGSDAAPTTVDGTWFYAIEDAAAGQYMTARFGNALRIQRIYKHGQADTLE